MKFNHTYSAIVLRCLLFSSLISLTGCGKQESPEPPQYQNPILSYVKTPAPRELATKTTELIGRFDEEGRSTMLLSFFLAGYGFPHFRDFDPETPLTVFYLRGDDIEKQNLVLLAKARPTAKLITEFAPQWNLSVVEHGEWLFIVQEEATLSLIESRDELIELATRKPAYDFEATILSRGVLDAREQIMARARERAEGMEEDSRIWQEAALQLFFQELASTDSIIAGLNFGYESVDMGLDLLSFRGSQLGEVIAGGSQGRTGGGRQFHRKDSLATVNDLPARALQSYFNYLAESLHGELPRAWQADFKNLQRTIDRTLSDWSGLGATSFAVEADQYQSIQFNGGTFSLATLSGMYDAFNQFYAAYGPGADTEDKPLFRFLPNAGKIQEYPYHELEWVAESLDQDAENVSTLLTLVESGMVQTNSRAQLTRFLNDQRAPIPEDQSLAADFSPRENHWLQGRLHVLQYYREIIESPEMNRYPAATSNPNLTRAILALENESVEPLTFNLTSGNYRLSWQASLPLSIIEAIMKKM